MFSIYRSSIFHFLRQPNCVSDFDSYKYIEDGALLVDDNKIQIVCEWKDVKKYINELDMQNVRIVDYSNYLILPGFIDIHVHYPQSSAIASYGERLIDWLNKYVFPEEKKFENEEYCKYFSSFFLNEILRNGTTTAMVYSTVHKHSAEALFETAKERNMCILTGKTMMDRNAPKYLLDTPQQSYDYSKELIEKYHGNDRLKYVITPRFAPTSTEEQLEVTYSLRKEYTDTYLQTHISENTYEVQLVNELYPNCIDYTDVYDKFGLLSNRSIFGHAIHLSDREYTRFNETDSRIAWCPTSNYFLGSGLFKIGNARGYGIRCGIGTDVGGGSSFSMIRTINEAYTVSALQNISFSPLDGIYSITLGNAEALHIDNQIGNFESGKYADFVVIDMYSTPILSLKMNHSETIEEKLFGLIILGDDRCVKATYVAGKLVHNVEIGKQI